MVALYLLSHVTHNVPQRTDLRRGMQRDYTASDEGEDIHGEMNTQIDGRYGKQGEYIRNPVGISLRFARSLDGNKKKEEKRNRNRNRKPQRESSLDT
jgi:hypothetical protein